MTTFPNPTSLGQQLGQRRGFIAPDERKLMAHDLAVIDALNKHCPDYFGAAIGGAFGGMLLNFIASRNLAGGDHSERHLLRYAAVGGVVAMAREYFSCKMGRGVSRLGHAMLEAMPTAPAPRSPVVTKGHFAGMPRPLHHVYR
jgi:hypothetical protein